MQIGFWESEISVSSKMVRVVREAASHEKRVPGQECKNWLYLNWDPITMTAYTIASGAKMNQDSVTKGLGQI